MIEKLIKIRNTLNAVELHGKQNLSYQLGAISEIENLISKISQQTKPDNQEANDNG